LRDEGLPALHAEITDATGRYGSSLLSLAGRSLQDDRGLGFEIRFRAWNAPAQPEVFARMPRLVRQALGMLNVQSGRSDVDLRLRFDPGTLARPGLVDPDFVRVVVGVRDATVKPVWFPYEVRNLSGRISAGMEELIFETPLIGWHGDGSIRLAGRVGLLRDSDSQVVVDAENIRVDDELRSALGQFSKPIKEHVELYDIEGGTLGMHLTVKGPVTTKGGRPNWALRLWLDGCTGTYQFFPYRLTRVDGQIDVRPDRISIRKLTGWHEKTAVEISGSVGLAPRMKGTTDVRLRLHTTNLQFSEKLKQALGARIRESWNLFRPDGTTDVDVVITDSTRSKTSIDTRISAALKRVAGRVPLGDRMLPVKNATGRIEAFGDVIRVSDLRAEALRGSVAADATAIRADDVTKISGRLAASDVSVAEVLNLLPGSSADRARTLQPRGRLNVRKCTFDIIQRPEQPVDLQYGYAVELRNAGLTIPTGADNGRPPKRSRGIRLSEINGHVSAENPRGRVATGRVELDKLRVMEYGTITEVTGDVRTAGPMFLLEDVRGRMFGGRIESGFRGATDLQFFNGWVRLAGVDVATLAQETGLSEQRIWGKLRGTMQLSGERVFRRDKPPTWRLSGSGLIAIDRANLGELPLLRSLINYREFLIDRTSVIEEADMSFEIRSDRLVIHRLAFTGKTLSLHGVGWIDYDVPPKVDLYFYRRARGSVLPPLPVVELLGRKLNEAFESLVNQIVVARVTGTLDDPKVTPVVAKGVSEQVMRLIIAGYRGPEGRGRLEMRDAKRGEDD
jgi:hypothetical protein